MTSEQIERFYAEFGRRVRAARESAGLTQQQLADKLDLTRSSVANIEAGRQRALMHMTAAIASATEASAGDLLPDVDADAAPTSLAPHLRRLSEDNREAVELLMRHTARSAADSARVAR